MLRTVYRPDSNLIRINQEVDPSFGGWADMDKTTEEICSEIRASRFFRQRDIELIMNNEQHMIEPTLFSPYFKNKTTLVAGVNIGGNVPNYFVSFVPLRLCVEFPSIIKNQ